MELEHGLKQIDIAPLINVVFLLLIFLMLTSSFILQSGIRVELPKIVTSEAVKYEKIEILVTGENQVYVNSRLVTSEELKVAFKDAAKKNQTILIKADRRVSLGRVAEVWDLARQFGIAQINIATNQE
jgi:biopolymer transport protein ExbD